MWIFSKVIFLGRLVVSSPKNLSGTHEKLHCIGEPFRLSGNEILDHTSCLAPRLYIKSVVAMSLTHNCFVQWTAWWAWLRTAGAWTGWPTQRKVAGPLDLSTLSEYFFLILSKICISFLSILKIIFFSQFVFLCNAGTKLWQTKEPL